MASVRLTSVAKSFGATQIIKGVTVDIRDGEFVALVGPSGSGKSTLLRMIAGLETATGGTIEIDGQVVNDVPPKSRDVAMVFQNYALYPHMTVRQNLGFALRMRGAAKAEIARCVDEAAKSLNLETLLERYPRELSGGQRQRVATGRAIVRNPQVFLFDEPLSNLDAKLRVQVRAELRELHRRLGVTCVYVTHDQVEAMTMADRIVVLRDGRVEQIGAPLELYDRPANTFVATFIGSPAMNLLEGRYRDGAVVLANGGALAVDPHAASDGTPMTVGIRPEHLDAVGPDEEGVEARVVALEPTGAETMITANLAGVVVTALTRRRVDWRAGDPIRLRPHPGRHLCFDAAGTPVPLRRDAASAGV